LPDDVDMNRDALDQLDRDALVRRAEEAGVERARVLTRPELVDELLLRSAAVDDAARQRSRGLFGRARDLLARVVEQGLHLPDAADRIRAMGLPPPAEKTAPAALPTVTLAQIYVAQGHRERAIDTLQKVIAREPEHAVAGGLLARLRDGEYPVPAPVLPPEEEAAPARASWESAEERDDEPPSGVPSLLPLTTPSPPMQAPRTEQPSPPVRADACTAVLDEPTTLRVSWTVRPATLAHAQRSPGGRIALCVHVVRPAWDGPRPTFTCYEVGEAQGEFTATDLPGGCVVRAAVGCLTGETFAPFAHSAPSETG
jgi:hypothetical protein